MTKKEFLRTLRRSFYRKYGYINPCPEDADEQLDEAERNLGFALPPMVRYVFKHGGEDFLLLDWSVSTYVSWRKDSGPDGRPLWPEKMLPIGDEGCGIFTCLDCSHDRAPVMIYHGDHPKREVSGSLHFEHESPSLVESLKRLIPRDEGGYA